MADLLVNAGQPDLHKLISCTPFTKASRSFYGLDTRGIQITHHFWGCQFSQAQLFQEPLELSIDDPSLSPDIDVVMILVPCLR